MALHCYINEYVFAESAEEVKAVERLQQEIAQLLENGQDVPASWIVALAAYSPLNNMTWADKMLEREWPGDLNEVIVQQVKEPREELSLLQQIPRLTPINDEVSRKVKDQYEESPYPRWVKGPVPDHPTSIHEVLQRSQIYVKPVDDNQQKNLEVLVAGCGTGKHSIATAATYSNANVVAVDLSLASIAYAMRKTRETDLKNIEYGQADILEMGSMDREFDVIECGGVLHHLDDPLAGWRVLAGLLKTGGFMRVGLYSETARRQVVVARQYIADKGLTATPEGIRNCRREIRTVFQENEMSSITGSNDFYSLSDCRDLLFHVQEHRFTIPQIETALQDLCLEFLGFEIIDLTVRKKFRDYYAENHDFTSLSQWHEYELKHPETFEGMYVFWCRKL